MSRIGLKIAAHEMGSYIRFSNKPPLIISGPHKGWFVRFVGYRSGSYVEKPWRLEYKCTPEEWAKAVASKLSE